MRIADLDDEDSNAKVMMQDDSLASQSEEPQHRKQEPLTQGAQLLKERLSHIPYTRTRQRAATITGTH